jgi:hypothetical protein
MAITTIRQGANCGVMWNYKKSNTLRASPKIGQHVINMIWFDVFQHASADHNIRWFRSS